MGRMVITERDVGRLTLPSGEKATPENVDQYKERLLKYIPSEIVAIYIGLRGIIETFDLPDNTFIAAILFCIIVTPIYLLRIMNVTKFSNLLVTTFAFVVWSFALGGEPFTSINWYNQGYGALILAMYTFCIPLFKAKSIQ